MNAQLQKTLDRIKNLGGALTDELFKSGKTDAAAPQDAKPAKANPAASAYAAHRERMSSPPKGEAEQAVMKPRYRPKVSNRTKALIVLLALFGASAAMRAGDVADLMDSIEQAKWSPPTAPAWLSAMFEPSAAQDTGDAPVDTATIETASTPGEKPQPAAKDDDADLVNLAESALDGLPSSPTKTPEPLLRLRRGAAGDDEAAGLLAALRKREAEIEAYANQLKAREKELQAAQTRIEARLKQLSAAKEEFSALLATVDQAARRDVEHLIAMYEKMKPKQAAPVFNAMAPNVAAGFLARMRANRASAILAKMDPQKAYTVSLTLAGRNVRAAEAGRQSIRK